MTVYIGAKKEIALTKETTRGTLVAAGAGDWIPHNGFGFNPLTEKVQRTPGMGHISESREEEYIREYSAGSLPLDLSVEFAGDLTNMIMGQAPDTSTPDGDYYDHVWSLANNNEHVSYTASVVDPIYGDWRAARTMLNSANLTIVPDAYVTCELDLMAQKAADTSLTPSYSTTNEFFKPQQVEVKFADTYAGLGAASETQLTNLNITVNKNCEYVWVSGDTEPKDIVNQRIAVSGDFELPYESTTFRALGLGDGIKAMQLSLTHGSYVFTIKLPAVTFNSWNDGEDVASYMPETISFMAHHDDTSGLIVMEVTDKTASH